MKAYEKLDDGILNAIAHSTEPALAVARSLIQRLRLRKLNKLIGETNYSPSKTVQTFKIRQ